ncbi:MAG: CHAT domain-containing protein, partial [Planctomycetes bacterium]|nr:CHAT domain-containing protein [Planctomycetota bacterium]
ITPAPAQPLMLGLPRAGGGEVFRSTDDESFSIEASLIHLSACRDSETADDTTSGGAFTVALLQAMSPPPSRDYDQLHANIRRRLASRRQLSELHVYGPYTDLFRKQHPFQIDLQSKEQVAATQKALDSALSALGLRDSGARDAQIGAHGIVLSRPPKHRLDLVLDGNSITEVRARAYVLAVFEGVTPGGPAGAIDELLGGTIRDFVARRMFSPKVGEVFILPTGNAPVPADLILFIGLGQLDQFSAKPNELQRLVAGNVIRTLIKIGVDEFATVLIGGGSGQSVRETLENLVAGFVEGLRDTDPGDRARRVILCENDPARYAEMVEAVYSLGRSKSFDDISTIIYERPSTSGPDASQRAVSTVATLRSRMFLHVRSQQGEDADSYEAVLLTSGGKATAIPSSRPYDAGDRDSMLRTVGTAKFNVEKFGTDLAKFALSEEFIETLAGPLAEGQHLIVVHDAESSKLPWETLRAGDRVPALDGGISRKYLLTGNFSIAKWLEKRRFDKTLDILLVIDPTEDLKGAEREGEIIRRLIQDLPTVRLTEIRGAAASRGRLLHEFQSGAYDVIHYAGHAGFNEADPGKSGILCAGSEVLSGEDLATVADLPALVFFNACESGRVRKASKPIERLRESVSFAEAFLRGGIANFIGTYWPVGDESAEAFAKTFYGDIVRGRAVGDALIAGRRVVNKLGSFDWADYIHYGDPDFCIKEAGGPR